MYDLNHQYNVGLCSFAGNKICYYLPQSKNIQFIEKKSHHYEKQNQITDLIQNIARQLFYYSNCLQKVTSKEQQAQVINTLLQNVKKITIYNCDKNGLIPQQKLFYLVISYLHSKTQNIKNLREYLNEVHYFLTSNRWTNSQEQLPFSLVMLLNGQFQQLLFYIKNQFSYQCHPQMIQNVIDFLVKKIQQNQANDTKSFLKKQNEKIIRSIEESEWLKKLQEQLRKKGQNLYQFFNSKHQIQIILAILAGNQDVVEQISKGSWGIYLNLYINYVLSCKNKENQSYENIAKLYIAKFFANSKTKKNVSENEQFLLRVLNTSVQSKNRFSFHEIYQNTFNIFSPILSHIIGLLLLQCKVIDLFSLFNNKEYYEQILLSLLEASSAVSWTSLFYTMGFMTNNSFFRDLNGKQTVWESVLIQHLPYQFILSDPKNDLEAQIKEIEQKIQDLNLIGLNSLTKSYLNNFFKLEIKQSNSNNKLNKIILQLFFLNIQISDNSNANEIFHLMKKFISTYYRTISFEYGLLDDLEGIFQRKKMTLSQKMISKIQKLFSLIYKIKRVYQYDQIETQTEEEACQFLLMQLTQFNKLFTSGSNKKSKISLCYQLLKLGTYLHQKIQSNLVNRLQIEQENQSSGVGNKKHLDQVKQFKRNIANYLDEWKQYYLKQSNQEKISKQIWQQIKLLQKLSI